MAIRIRGFIALGIGACLIVACGGVGGAASGSTSAPATSAASSGGTDASSGDTGATSTSTVVVTTAAAGEGTAASVCELVKADELAEIFHVASVTTEVVPGPPDTCIVTSDADDPLASWSLSTDQAQVVFDALTADPASIEVPGVGESAYIVQNTGLLVLKNGQLAVISISGAAELSEEEGIEASKMIAAIVAGRM